MEFLYEYGLFLAKAITLVGAILVVVGGIAATAMKQKSGKGHLDIVSLSDRMEELANNARQLLMDKQALKKFNKEQKKQKKEANSSKDAKQTSETAKLFVIEFHGSMDAHEVERLREEVTAILLVAEANDEVLVKLESGGGVVHGYGLAASQLQRIKDKQLKLTIAVDKVAASGGYMMACVADTILASKFAIIGSIGVIAQLPNFNKLLKSNNIEFEQHTAGQFKRTLTLFGENNDEGREKFREELEEVHQAFKAYVGGNRADLDMDKVATGEHWYGDKALELGLVDKIQTSDDFLLEQYESKQIYSIKYSLKKNVVERLGIAASTSIETALVRLMGKLSSWGR